MKERSDMEEVIRKCPYCSAYLQLCDSRFICSKCNKEFRNVDGIWCFVKNPTYSYSDFLHDQDLAVVNSQNWHWAVKKVLEGLPLGTAEAAYRRIFDETRAAWKVLVNLNPEGYVLDIGCGYGGIIRSLAPHFKKCVAMDLSLGRLKFAQALSLALGIHNVEYIHGGDTPFLPFDDHSFDLVVLNAVLEWIPVTYPNKKPWDAQFSFLQEVLRILRPGGCVYIASENRLAWKYWLGLPEDHIGLPFIALMPRGLADVYAKLIRRTPYRTHTYTIFGYRRLLRQSGYSTIRFCSLIPTHRHFTHIFDLSRSLTNVEQRFLNPKESVSWRRKLERFALKCIAKGKLLPYLTHSLGMIAWKERERATFIDLIKDREGFEKLLSIRITGGHNIALIFEKNGQRFFVKVPITSIGCKKFEYELKVLEQLQQILQPSVASALPSLQVSEVLGIKYSISEFFEELLNGKNAVSGSKGDVLSTTLEWLETFLRCTEREVIISEDLWNEFIIRKIDFISKNLVDNELKELLKALSQFLHNHLYGKSTIVTYIHGDFKLENIFINPNTFRVAKVMDWDHGGEFFPVVDKIEIYTSFILRRYSRMRGVPKIGHRLLIALENSEREKEWKEIFSKINLCLYWLYRMHRWAKWSYTLFINPAELHDSKMFLSEILKRR